MKSPSTVDIPLEFLKVLIKQETSLVHKLIRKSETTSETSIADLGEGCAFYQAIESEYEEIFQTSHEHPASWESRIHFYVIPSPRRPSQGSFIRDKQEFPLADTKKIEICGDCNGSGHVSHSECRGSGSKTCSRCNGSGKQTGSDVGTRACSKCNGSGREKCRGCNGTGRVKCRRCDGEGRLLKYNSEIYKYFPQEVDQNVMEEDANRLGVKRKFLKVMRSAGGHFNHQSFTEDEVEGHLGIMNPKIASMTHRAAEEFAQLERRTETPKRTVPGHRYNRLFRRDTKKVTPIGYVNTYAGRKYGQFWSIGTRKCSETVLPPIPIDKLKLVVWIYFLACCACLITVTAAYPEFWKYTPLLAIGLPPSIWVIIIKRKEHKNLAPDDFIVFMGPLSSEKSVLFALAGYVVSYEKIGVIVDEYYVRLLQFLRGEDLHSGLSSCYGLRLKKSSGFSRLMRIVNLNSLYLYEMDGTAKAILQRADRICLILDPESKDKGLMDQRIASVLSSLNGTGKSPFVTIVVNSTSTQPASALQSFPALRNILSEISHQYMSLDIWALQRKYLDGELTVDEWSEVLSTINIDVD